MFFIQTVESKGNTEFLFYDVMPGKYKGMFWFFLFYTCPNFLLHCLFTSVKQIHAVRINLAPFLNARS